MKSIFLLSSVLLAFFLAMLPAKGDVSALWTFETAASTNHIIGAGTSPGTTQSGVAADIGSGTAMAVHASASTAWSLQTGNGSAHAWSSDQWAPGDYYEFHF